MYATLPRALAKTAINKTLCCRPIWAWMWWDDDSPDETVLELSDSTDWLNHCQSLWLTWQSVTHQSTVDLEIVLSPTHDFSLITQHTVTQKHHQVTERSSMQHVDGWQHKGAMSTFWWNWDFDTKW